MKTAVLRGRDQELFGGLGSIAEGDAAIALSRGAAQKRYSYKDPNEDCAAFALGTAGIVLVVADGHHGREAAEIAVERILVEHAPRWTSAAERPAERWAEWGLDALADVNAAILDRAAGGGAPDSRTTLALAVVRPDENLLLCASAADSHVFRVGGAGVVDLARGPSTETVYLGAPAVSRETLREHAVVTRGNLAGAAAVVLTSDGFAEAGVGVASPPAVLSATLATAAAAESGSRALEVARSLVEQALEAHRRQSAGDNVASAVWVRCS